MPLSHAQVWKAIDAVARQSGLTASGLARRAGLDATSFNPSKRISPNQRPRWPSTESVSQVLAVAGLTLADFAKLADDAPEQPFEAPLIGLAQAGQDGFFDDAGLPTGEGWEQTQLPAPGPSIFSIRITGDSMVPLYREGDKVIVDRDVTEVRRGDRVVVRTTSGETLAKEITSLTAKAVTLGSINTDYEPRVIPRKDIDWMSRILWVSQ